jgi:tetratricopeptide (TPR) repeat protein
METDSRELDRQADQNACLVSEGCLCSLERAYSPIRRELRANRIVMVTRHRNIEAIQSMRLIRGRILRKAVVAFGFLSIGPSLSLARQDVSPTKLRSDMGSLHHPIATKNPESQKFFDQGLTFVYAFNFEEAQRSFERASELDPNAPMPYWGLALALGPNYNSPFNHENDEAAEDAIRKAQQLAVAGPENERAYINALAQRYTHNQSAPSGRLLPPYVVAMRELSRQYPDDPDAATLFADSLMELHPWQLWTSDGKPNENTLEIVWILEKVLAQWPEHVGANHLYIHAMEASPFPGRALASARRLETLVPAAGHLIHMPAHIYFRIGDYQAAVKSTQNAAVVDRNYLRGLDTPNVNYRFGYAEHNIRFLVASASMDGEFQTAYNGAMQLASEAPAILEEKPGAEEFLVIPTFVLLRFARWDDVLALPAPNHDYLGANLIWHYARGCALAMKGRTAQAEAERREMESVFQDLPIGPAFGVMFSDWGTLHKLAEESLDARISRSRGDLKSEIGHWQAATAVQDRMRYAEPPEWYCPVRESLGAAILRSGNPALAEKIFRDDLARNPRSPRSLFGLWKALESQQKTADAAWIRASLEATWKGTPNVLRVEDL